VVQRLSDTASGDSDTETRVQAVLALADGNATEAVGDLINLIETAAPRVQQMALLALAELAEPGNERVLEVARHATNSPLPALRYQGLVALRHVAASQAVLALVSALSDLDMEVRWVAVRLLDELSLDETRSHGPQANPPWVAEASSSVRAAQRDSSVRVALAARLLLARWGDAEAILSLADLFAPGAARMDLQDELAVIRLVAQFGVEQAKPALAKRAWPVLFETALTFEARVALAAMGDRRAREAILRDLNSASPLKCARAVEPVGRLRLAEGRARLVQLLQNPGHLDVATIRLALGRVDA
jgi:HEAT repeat protein